jgi:hypothetical protein
MTGVIGAHHLAEKADGWRCAWLWLTHLPAKIHPGWNSFKVSPMYETLDSVQERNPPKPNQRIKPIIEIMKMVTPNASQSCSVMFSSFV